MRWIWGLCATLMLWGCDDPAPLKNHCQGACDVAQSCAVTLRFPFTCGEPDATTCETTQTFHDCAHCVAATSCDQLRLGECNAYCN